MLTNQAVQYARNHGLFLFPVRPDKRPATVHGFKDAQSDPTLVADMFTRPNLGMGVHPGRSGYVVVDIDVKDGGEGNEQWHDLGIGFDGPEVLTPSGGRHLWFRKPEGLTFDNTALDTSIDIRGDNGYVILPDSFKYEWELGYGDMCQECDFAHPRLEGAPEFPQALVERLTKVKEWTGDPAGDGPILAGSRYDTLFRLGRKMRFQGMPESAIRAALLLTNKERCQPPHPDSHVLRILQGVMRPDDPPVNPETGATRPEKSLVRVRHVPSFDKMDWSKFWHQDFETPDWLVKPLVVKGEITSVYAAAGEGKSEFVLYCMVQAALKGTRVLWLDREMSGGMLRERLESFGLDEGTDLTNLTYVLYPDLAPLDTEEGGLALMERMVDQDLVVLDSLSKFLTAEEDSNNTQTLVHNNTYSLLRANGKAMLTIDHAGKNVALGARGASAKKDNVDLFLRLKRSYKGTLLDVEKKRHLWIADHYGYAREEDPLRYLSIGQDHPIGTCTFGCGRAATHKAGPALSPVCDECEIG